MSRSISWVPIIMRRNDGVRPASAALIAILWLAAQAASAQDVVAVSPETHVVTFENSEVRVLTVRLRPGEKVAMHSHPRNVAYCQSDAKLRITTADGKVEDRTVKSGTAAWSDGAVHSVENIGSSDFVEVQVELKAQDSVVKQQVGAGLVAQQHGTPGPVVQQQVIPELTGFAKRYAAAWSSRNPTRLAAFYAEDGSLIINGGPPATGRAAIAAKARSFMTAFPDMLVKLQRMDNNGEHPVFHWIWTGTNLGPGGTGKSVRITGYEEWTMDASGHIAKSEGHYDEAEYQRQLKVGAPRQ
jgi:quercetin dioxygenase-like cupin family protein